MHNALQELLTAWQRRQQVSPADLDAIFAREWRSAGYEDAYQEEQYRLAGQEQLQAFREKFLLAPPDVLFLEKPFRLPMEPGVVVTGRMDRVDRLPDGTVEIVDYKTGAPKELKDAKNSLQLRLYAIAAREILELKPSRLTFYNLGTNQAVTSTRDEKALESARQEVAEVADSLRAGEFPARPGFVCRYCNYRLLCPEHEDLLTIRPAGLSAE